MAIFSAGGNLGFAAGPAVIAFFIAAFGLRATPVLAVPAAVVALVLFLLLPSRELAARTAGDSRVTWKGLPPTAQGVRCWSDWCSSTSASPWRCRS